MPRVLGLKKCSAVVATAAVLALGLLPAEHIHVSRHSDGHHSSVAHSHFESHHGDEAPVVDEKDHDGAQWLRITFLHSQKSGATRAASSATCDQPQLEPRTRLTSREQALVLFVSVHDPPWATPSGLRAPPSSRL